jgi:hypothetical protein
LVLKNDDHLLNLQHIDGFGRWFVPLVLENLRLFEAIIKSIKPYEIPRTRSLACLSRNFSICSHNILEKLFNEMRSNTILFSIMTYCIWVLKVRLIICSSAKKEEKYLFKRPKHSSTHRFLSENFVFLQLCR